MVGFVVYVHQGLQELDVKFEMHVKVTLAWTEEHVNLSMGMVDINVYVRLDIVAHDVKIVCILHVFMLLSIDQDLFCIWFDFHFE
jgi:hypothetical protein